MGDQDLHRNYAPGGRRALSIGWLASFAPDFAGNDITEQLPCLAFKTHELQLFNRPESVGLILIFIPGSIILGTKFFKFAACFITFSRERSSPHCLKTCTSVCDSGILVDMRKIGLVAVGDVFVHKHATR